MTATHADATPQHGISVVVPVYNSEASLVELASRLEPVLTATRRPFELVLVDDGSRDGSWRQVAALAGRLPWVRGVRLMRNFGQHNALLAGIRQARFDVTVTMDDDLQHPPEELPRLLEKLEGAGLDVVYGTPRGDQHERWRNASSVLTKLALQNLMGVENARHVSAFRAFRTRLREAFGQYRSPFVSVDVILTWGTSRFGAVQVEHHPRKHGRSNYSLSSLFRHAVLLVTGFTDWPLRLASIMGIGLAGFGLAVLVFVLGRYLLTGGSIPGFPFLASIIAIFSGAQMFALGIMGEYMARMHHRMMEKPVYVVDAETPRPAGADVSAPGAGSP